MQALSLAKTVEYTDFIPLIHSLQNYCVFFRVHFWICILKDWPAKKVTIFNTIVHLVKTSENILFFACILPDYVADEITKEF